MTNFIQKNHISILVISPCYNEDQSIKKVVESLKSVKLTFSATVDILVINDCSTDNTLNIIKECQCQYLDLPINLGIGGAMQAGFKYAYLKNYDIAVQVDGDGQHPANELNKLLLPIINEDADITIGSRFIEKQGFQSTISRRIGIRYFHWLNKFLTNVSVFDSTSGFRAFNHKAIKIVNKYYPDEYPEPESIVMFGLYGLGIKEVPVIMQSRQGGVSSIRSWNTIYYMFKVTLGCIFTYLRTFKLIKHYGYNTNQNSVN